MALKLNVNRTHWVEVPVPEQGAFKVEMKILKEGQEDMKISELIVSVDGLELEDETGRVLGQSETIEAVQKDTQLASLVSQAWAMGNQNTLKKQRTLLQPQES